MTSRTLIALAAVWVPILAVACSGSDYSAGGPTGTSDGGSSGDATVSADGAIVDPSHDGGNPQDSGANRDGEASLAEGGYTYLRGVNNVNFLYTDGYGNGYGPAVTTLASYQYLYSRGIRLIRLEVPWGPVSSAAPGLQNTLSGTLDATVLDEVHQEVDNLHAAGLVAALDVHSSCHFPGSKGSAICGNGITTDDVKSLWTQLSAAFQADPGVYAYDLMNEPYNITSATWKTFSQAMVDAIRARGDDKLLWVEGINYSNAGQFSALNGTPWITDPKANILYSGHTYPPTSTGGSWQSTTYNATSDAAWLTELSNFTSWCSTNHVKCGIGEMAWPASTIAPDWMQWNALGERWYTAADAANLTVTFFTASSTQNNPNDIYVHDGGNDVDLNTKPSTLRTIDTALSQAVVLEAHPSK